MNNPTTVRDLLILWREKFPDRPWTWFALRCGLSATTLQRIFEGKIEKPSYPTARIIALHVLQKEDARIFLCELFPNRKKQIEIDFHNFQSIGNSSNEKLIALYSDYFKYRIYVIAASTGITSEQIEKLGPIYVAKASEMVADDLIFMQSGVYSVREKEEYIIESKYLNSIAGFITKALDEKLQNRTFDENGHILFKFDGLSEEGYSKVSDVLQKAYREACQICDSGLYTGSLSASFLSVLSRID